ncbi:cbb3-type cytochrome oxidase subunit 3 [Marinobacterium sediminicola]|uniref:Cbb3-type cytochrome oxidase, subunit 3 n=1 Tax=Marinobacterium sediminicola TaxID=518898 RepID=A0ABY1RVP4_9GAMM|nr:cbb3-type cytochrome c oxidase subunit 3 [Marinobacterium sediminicola]ULG70585.1 cbb3-type cytochrome c oxidase subunit 3 [Marinobacterium sediminicola]SMR68942.1 Cbb3-type cytochrome oxidase, subunit 3 [Marinobacterium sediminicola]
MSYEVYGPYLPVVMLLTFIGLFAWVLLPGNKKGFDEASQLPFADEEKQDEEKQQDQEGTHNRRDNK